MMWLACEVTVLQNEPWLVLTPSKCLYTHHSAELEGLSGAVQVSNLDHAVKKEKERKKENTDAVFVKKFVK